MSQLLEQTYNKLRGDLKSFINSRVNNNELSEDILHDVFLKAHTKIQSLKDMSKLNGWLYQIARNAITDYYRTKKPLSNIEDFDIEDKKHELPVIKKLEPTLRSFLKYLPPIYREAIVLTDFKGMTQKALAEKLNLSVSAAKSRVQRARAMLKDLFMQCCHFEFDKFGSLIDYGPGKNCKSCACGG